MNVFLGLGMPWIVATVYYQRVDGTDYMVPSGDLAFSVLLFLICCSIGVVILIFRRIKVGGELGGLTAFGRYLSAAVLVTLWVFYILFSSLKVYGHV